MIIDITNEILTKLKTDLSDVKVKTSYQDENDYPLVVFVEQSNVDVMETKDSEGVQHNEVMFQVDIFTKGNDKMTSAKSIRNLVDAIIGDFYGLARIYSDEVPNYSNRDIYRYTMRFTGLVDDSRTIYRR